MNLIQVLSAQPWVERLGWTLIHFAWQGSLVAAVYGISRSLLGQRASARLRYGLACGALAMMTMLPIVTFGLKSTMKPVRTTALRTDVSAPSESSSVTAKPRPFESLPSVATPVWRDDPMTWLVAIWLVGVIGFWVRLSGGWIVASRIRSMSVRSVPAEWQQRLDRLKHRVRVSSPVRLLTSALVKVPTVVGWLRPVILLPVGALTGLAPEHIEALLLHELAHIRRNDYLINLLQSTAEVLLFYHPAVWWISDDIRQTREFCCDDVAVSASGDVVNYVRALAGLESHRPEHFTPAMAANGGSLPDRVAHVLGYARPMSLRMPAPGIAASAVLTVILAFLALAQSADSRPAFEVASIKPDNSDTGVDRIDISKGSLIIENVSLKRCIGMAFGVEEGRDYLFSGPDWLDTQRFDIRAKFPSDTPDAQVLLMLQRLLEERFQLALHREKREFSAYALVAAKNGPKLKPAAQQGPYKFRVQAGHASGSSLSMPAFANRLSRPVFQLDHQVVDFTGLTGTFDLTLDWKPEGGSTDNPAAGGSDASIFAALQEQLGLKLEARKVPIDVLVVDKANKVPASN